MALKQKPHRVAGWQAGQDGSPGNPEPGQIVLAVGKHPVLDALERSPDKVDAVFLQQGLTRDRARIEALCRANGIRFSIVARNQLDKVAGTANHQGVAARLFLPGYLEPEELIRVVTQSPLALILALDQIQDPGNVGVLARTLLAFGGAGLVVTKNRSAFLGAGAMKSSAGALERLPVVQVVNLSRFLDQCSEAGLAVYGAGTGQDAVPVFEARLRLPCVLVLGNEDKGVRPGVAGRCDGLVTIPMAGDMESLNVAQAGAIILGEFVRRRLSGQIGEG